MLMGAGIPRSIPAILDRLAAGDDAAYLHCFLRADRTMYCADDVLDGLLRVPVSAN